VRRIWVPQLIATLALLGALVPSNPYGYYILLRWVCCGIFAYLAVQAFHRKNQVWAWISLGLRQVSTTRSFEFICLGIWSVVNVFTIGIAVVSILALKAKDQRSEIADGFQAQNKVKL
jgi:uncharacterized protein DUF6804